MSNKIKAFTYQLGREEVSEANVVQHNAGWVIGVVPFDNPDTFGIDTPAISDAAAVASRGPFVIVNDCVTARVSYSKANPFGSAELMLKSGDINYLGMIFPGDFIFVWMHHNRAALEPTIQSFLNSQPANGFKSGLKFFGRVDSVRKHLRISNPAVGTKELFYMLNAVSFQELNTKVYIVPFLTLDTDKGFMAALNTDWYQIMNKEGSDSPGTTNVQAIFRQFVNIFLGTGPKSIQQIKGSSPNESFLLPRVVGKVLGRTLKEPKAFTPKFTDIMTLLQGVHDYSTTSTTNPNAKGFIPRLMDTPIDPVSVRQYSTPWRCTGENLTFGQKWQDTTIWEILNQYLNPAVNELYCCMRVDLDGRIVPTMIMRQIPFSTQEYMNKPFKQGGAGKDKHHVTFFMSLPRWKPNPAMVVEHDIGRSNALRVNYVQLWGEAVGGPGMDGQGTGGSGATTPTTSTVDYQTMQWLAGNNVLDHRDIKRSGLRTYTTTVPFDFPTKDAVSYAALWSHLVSDWVINGHLKTSGTVVLTGVAEPICIGDNFEWDGAVLHIEQVAHTCQISPTGAVTFRTTLALSNGLSVNTDEVTRYPDMDNMYREKLAEQDRNRDKVYPGYTDVESRPNRESPETPGPRTSPNFNRPSKK